MVFSLTNYKKLNRHNKMKEVQIKSKLRVSDHGEVFTNEREVNAMLDLVKTETERIDSKFLEPACGTGNFLIKILTRKLEVVIDKFKDSQIDFERNTILAVSSIYGIELLFDNLKESRVRLYNEVHRVYSNFFKNSIDQTFLLTVEFILKKNLVHGNTLSMLFESENDGFIVFPQWEFISEYEVTRKDFRFDHLVEHSSTQEVDINGEVIPVSPVKCFKPKNFKELYRYEI